MKCPTGFEKLGKYCVKRKGEIKEQPIAYKMHEPSHRSTSIILDEDHTGKRFTVRTLTEEPIDQWTSKRTSQDMPLSTRRVKDYMDEKGFQPLLVSEVFEADVSQRKSPLLPGDLVSVDGDTYEVQRRRVDYQTGKYNYVATHMGASGGFTRIINEEELL